MSFPRLADDRPPEWNYSPDPAVESMMQDLRLRYPPLMPAGLARFRGLLKKLGDPHVSRRLPPVFHVAGTNGKGSVLAFLQALFAAGGQRVHRFTSPHLVRFEERIVVGGQPVAADMLRDLIARVDRAAADETVSFFEFFTAVAFLSYAENPADALLLETGLGGTLDATNVVESCAAAVLTRISFDHTRILGGTLQDIAGQKAGIIKPHCPVVIAPQFSPDVMPVFEAQARAANAPLLLAGRDWQVSATGQGFSYSGPDVSLALPAPALAGAHQVTNAGTALTALVAAGYKNLLTETQTAQAMRQVVWPGRLQRLTEGHLAALLPPGWELWLDGAHNDSGAEVLRDEIIRWQATDPKPLHLITAYKGRKEPDDFYKRLAGGLFASAQIAAFPIDAPMEPPEALQALLQHLGFPAAGVVPDVAAGIRKLVFESSAPQRILVTGSLYLVGHALKENEF